MILQIIWIANISQEVNSECTNDIESILFLQTLDINIH